MPTGIAVKLRMTAIATTALQRSADIAELLAMSLNFIRD
jgi:hypothetical protein